MRLALLAPTSIDIAAPIRSGPTTSPIIVRRTGLSVVQAMPLTKLASATCQTASAPVQASSARTSEVSSIEMTTTISAVRRSMPLGQGADHRAEQRHRQHAQHRHHRDDEGRAGVLIGEDRDRQHFQPAHREDDEADQPEPAKIGFAKKPCPACCLDRG